MSEFCGEQTATERAFLLLDPDRDGKISKQVHICEMLSMMCTYFFDVVLFVFVSVIDSAV